MDLEQILIPSVLDLVMLLERLLLTKTRSSLIVIFAIQISACHCINFLLQEDFFIVLHDMLLEMQEVTELHPVPDAHVPVLKFKFSGISIDLLYARLALWVIPEVVET